MPPTARSVPRGERRGLHGFDYRAGGPPRTGVLHDGGVSFRAAASAELARRDTDRPRLRPRPGWAGCAAPSRTPGTHPPHTDGAREGRPVPVASRLRLWPLAKRRDRYDLRPASVSVEPLGVGAWGVARLVGRRSRACRCSGGRHPSGSDSEARDRHAALPQPHRSGVDERSTPTRLPRVCRLQKPFSLPTCFVLASIAARKARGEIGAAAGTAQMRRCAHERPEVRLRIDEHGAIRTVSALRRGNAGEKTFQYIPSGVTSTLSGASASSCSPARSASAGGLIPRAMRVLPRRDHRARASVLTHHMATRRAASGVNGIGPRCAVEVIVAVNRN